MRKNITAGSPVTNLLFLFVSLLISTVVYGCYPDGNWQQIGPDRFIGSDITKAREELPFTFILPKYLPLDLYPQPRLEVFTKVAPHDSALIHIDYARKEKESYNYVIYIEEANETMTQFSETEYNLDISGVKVQEYRSSISQNIYSFVWNRGGIRFYIKVISYDRTEALKILESMIN